MDLNLDGKVAIITGPAKGMGAAVTRQFADEGCQLVLVGRDTGAIETIAGEVRANGAEAVIAECDITDSGACEEAVEVAKQSFGGRIDILINIAGGSGPIGKSGAETTPEEFEEILTLNVNGCFHTIRAVANTMIDQKYGKIVNVGGRLGCVVGPEGSLIPHQNGGYVV